MVRHGGSSAGSYLADPTSPIPSHCASTVATSTLRVNSDAILSRQVHQVVFICSHVDNVDVVFTLKCSSKPVLYQMINTPGAVKYWPSGMIKVSMLTHTYPHKPLRKIKVTICNHQADSQLDVWTDV